MRLLHSFTIGAQYGRHSQSISPAVGPVLTQVGAELNHLMEKSGSVSAATHFQPTLPLVSIELMMSRLLNASEDRQCRHIIG